MTWQRFNLLFLLLFFAADILIGDEYLRLPAREYIDRMAGGWLGQMVGVGWGAPTEFRYCDELVPDSAIPQWHPSMVNQFYQDDLYVEISFLSALDKYGLDITPKEAGIAFANTSYGLAHANLRGRTNLRRGIAPPDSGHPQFNPHADDIDYQIEADYSGLIAPGLFNVPIKLGGIFGKIMNYGDGVYGGQFVGGMYASAFFERDMVKVVEAGLSCIPQGSQYHECISDVLSWYRENPNDWKTTWLKVKEKYQDNPDYRRFSCSGPNSKFNIDAKINGAFVVIGLLYGKRDIEETIKIAMQCGQDSDCNPSTAGGVLFTTIGFSKIPSRYKEALDREAMFADSDYDFPKLIAVCEKLARETVTRCGGKIIKDKNGEEIFLIPVRQPRPSRLEQSWAPAPLSNSEFTEEEKERLISFQLLKKMQRDLEKLAPGWRVENCGGDMDPGFYQELNGRKNVLLTHPLDPDTGCILKRRIFLPLNRRVILSLEVGHHPQGDWLLLVRINGMEVKRQLIDNASAPEGWINVDIDLSAYSGQEIEIELENQPNGWSFEAGYWAKIELKSL